MKIKRYRVVRHTDRFDYPYSAQRWSLFFPFWVEIDFVNSHKSKKAAKKYIKAYKEIVGDKNYSIKNLKIIQYFYK